MWQNTVATSSDLTERSESDNNFRKAHGSSISAMDKALDSDPGKNHEFLLALDKLTKKKIENPGLRFSTKSALKEELTMQEETTSGLRAPKKSFMLPERYEKKFGRPDPSLIKTIRPTKLL